MNGRQKIGGIAALITAALFVTSFIFILFVWPIYGVRGPEDVSNPAVILPSVARAPILLIWLAINVPIAAAFCFVVLALDEHLQQGPAISVRFALVVGLAAALLFFIVGALRSTGYPYFASQYLVNPADAASAYNGYLAIDNAFDHAAIFASGWWLVLVSWAALKMDRLQGLFNYFGLVVGAAGIIGSILPSFAPVALLLYIGWFLWFGILVMGRRVAYSVS